MATSHTGQRRYCFGEFILDLDRAALWKGNEPVRLRRQSFDVLRYLVEHRGRLVTRNELLEAVWGKTVVTDGSLTQCLIDVRRAIGDSKREAIRTVPRRGYIFEAAVAEPTGFADVATAIERSGAGARRHRRFLAGGAGVLLAAAVIGALIAFRSPPGSPPAAPGRVAVLPFADMSAAQDHRWLSDGISEEILNLLGQSPDLHVIARTSSFAFRDQDADIATVAEKLGVAYLVQGSLRRSGDRIRVTTQLVDTATGTEVWSGAYDRELGDVLTLQSEIAGSVATALEATVSRNPAAPREPESAAAWQAFLQGRFFHNRRSAGDLERAAEYFRQALEMDPTYGHAWAGLAGTHFVRIGDDDAATSGDPAEWQEAVEQALRYASEDPEVQLRAAQFRWWNGEPEVSMEHVRQAAAGPQNPLVLSALSGISLLHGRLDEAITRQRQAVDLDPLAAVGHVNLAGLLARAGRFEEALFEEEKGLDLNPSGRMNFERAIASILIMQERFAEALDIVHEWPEDEHRDKHLAMIYQGLGRTGEADAALERLRARPGLNAAFCTAEVHAYRGDMTESFRWLQVVLDGTPSWRRATRMQEAQLSPFMTTLGGDPRWQDMLDQATLGALAADHRP